MNRAGSYLSAAIIFVVLALTTAGCATKSYVRAQIAPASAKIGALETKTGEQADKEQTDVSRVEEKLGSTDSNVEAVAAAARQAIASAAQANQLAQQDQTAIADNQSAIAAGNVAIATLGKAMSYSLVAEADVTFNFDKSDLGKADQSALDSLMQQVQSMPRVVFELVGFTDPVGTAQYNFALSRRRADSVARYLVRHGVSLQGVHIIGLGKEPLPSDLLADVQAADPNVTGAEAQRLARRVLIRVYAANAGVESASLR